MKYLWKQHPLIWSGRERKAQVFLLLCLFVLLGSRCEPEQAMSSNKKEPVLSIALQDGFEKESIVVRVNGKEVYRNETVQTDYRISLADSFETPLPDSPIVVEVELPEQSITDSLQFESDTTIYVGISWLDGKLLFKTSETPFGYL